MDCKQVDLLRRIQQVQFGVIELNLYLNTHPRDRRALDEHNELAARLMELEQKYEDHYGMLYATSLSEYPWEWINEPWPWEMDYTC